MPNANDSGRSARRGFYILAGLVVGAILIANLQAITERLRRHVDIVALVPDAPAVRVGTPVWAEGVRVGRVTDVRITPYQDTTFVALDLRLEPRARAIVTPASEVRVVRRRAIGEPSVRITAGAPGDPILQPGDTIVGFSGMTPEELLARSQELLPLLDSLRTSAGAVQTRFEGSRPRMERAVRQLETVMEASAALADQVEHGRLAALPAQLRALQQRVGQLQAAAERLTAQFSPDSDDGLAAQVREVTRRAEGVEAALAGLRAEIEAGDGFIGRIQEDPALQLGVEGIEAQIDSLVAEAWSIALRMFLP